MNDRLSYIGKEKDKENNLGDHGVRKYDYETGRFNSIDPLFEKYYGWSPYQYSMNNPIWAKDWNGEVIETIADVGFIAYDLWDIGVTLYNGDKVTATQMTALGADILGAAVPFATGGGMAVRAIAKVDDAVDAAKGLSKAEDAIDAVITMNKIPEGKSANHIFSGKSGKLPDNPSNRSLIEDLTNNNNNLLGKDKYGKSWYAKTLENGKQIYGYTQDGVVKGAGINDAPLDIIKNQGIK